MPDFDTLVPADIPMFHVEWETTLKCNLDCSYCGDGHDNKSSHPSLDDSIKTIDFILEYVERYTRNKPDNQKHVNLNVFGGESFFHPNIKEILEHADKQRKKYDGFTFNISTITNAVVGPTQWKEIVPLLDYFTVSYHAEANNKQKRMLRNNILHLKEQDKKFHVSIMMHPDHWQDCENMIGWCKEQNVSYNARQIDHSWLDLRFNYSREQKAFLTGKKESTILERAGALIKGGFDLSSEGRKCCGGGLLCANNTVCDYVKGNNFKGWHCSVNEFFLYIRQVTGEVFTNKDCKMNFDGSVGPIGYLSDTKSILDRIGKTDTIICKKKSCWCGLCAPKAKSQKDYEIIMKDFRC